MHLEAHPDQPKPSRKGKERDMAPRDLQPTNIDQQLIMAKRRAAKTEFVLFSCNFIPQCP